MAKNRNGPDGLVFPTFVDWSNVNIKVLSRDDKDSVANVIKDSDQNTLQYLKDRYKKKTNNERYTC